jgi:transposase InsO family protein
VVAALEPLWLAGNQPCGKRLAPFLPELLAVLERHGELTVPSDVRAALRALSAATIDRLLAPARQRHQRQPQAPQAAPRALQLATPLRLWSAWADATPGMVQADLVLHCGEATAGFYLATLTVVDVASGWQEYRAVWGTSKRPVQGAMTEIQRRLPCALRELHTDNGGEFLNETLVSWCTREGIRRTRGRPYRKNDQAYVEQRNWTGVRQLVGYDRYSTQTALVRLQRVYELSRLYQNFFQPVRKLIGREREGSKVRKRFDVAQTPYQRLLSSGVLGEPDATALREQYERLNPVQLRQQLDAALTQLWQAAERPVAHAREAAPREPPVPSDHADRNPNSEATPAVR